MRKKFIKELLMLCRSNDDDADEGDDVMIVLHCCRFHRSSDVRTDANRSQRERCRNNHKTAFNNRL